MGLTQWCKKGTGIFLHYETVKFVDIKNERLGALYRFIQLVIIGYIIGYAIVYKKGYQETDVSINTVSVKVKGTTYVDFGDFNSTFFNGIQVYDPADYVIPPQETDAFFVMTNMIITPRQRQSTCDEDPEFKDNHCEKDKDCLPELEPVRNGNGVRTGKCVLSKRDNKTKVCEIYGWCPTEVETFPMPNNNFGNMPLLDGTKESTVLIKNQISFPKFKVERKNIIQHEDHQYFKSCSYDSKMDPLCPKFKLGNIVKECGDNYTKVGLHGAVYGIIIRWNCDLDKNIEMCSPIYSFRRLDNSNSPVSPGYNFRYSTYYVEDKIRYRILTKAYGIKFVVLVHGEAGKFSPMPLFINIGAGMALLGIATILCDLTVMHLLKNRDVYKQHKYQEIKDGDNSIKMTILDMEDDQAIIVHERYR